MSQKVLITTANYSFTKSPVLFLGNWCLNYHNKQVWTKMNYEVLDKNFFSIKNNLKINESSKKIYEILLKELSIELNNKHQINWPIKSWRIVIGPWLYRFISCLNSKIELIKQAKNKNNNLLLESDEDVINLSLASYDLEDFSDKMLKDKYNKYLFAKIFKLLENQRKNNSNNIDNIHLENKEKSEINLITILKNKFLKVVESTLCKKNKFVFFKIYLGNIITTLKLCFKLKEVPFKYNIGEKRFFFNFDSDLRNKHLKFKKDDANENEKIIRYFLSESLPTIYFEGFEEIFSTIKKSFLPTRKIEFIYTCSLLSDTLFKFWTAEKVSKGTKIIYGQHGGNTNFSKDSFKTDHEIDISENYISWGWENDNPKIKKGYCFAVISKDTYKKKSNSKILLVLPPIYHYHFYNKISFFNELNLGEKESVLASSKLNLNFIEKNIEIKDNLYIRLHPNDYRTETPFKSILTKKFNNLKYDTSKDILKTFNNYELIIFGYFEATPFLHCLALNKPCMVLSPLDKNIFTAETRRHLDKFVNLGIVDYKAFNLKQKLQKLGGEINKWWYNNETQEAIKMYTFTSAFKDNNSIERIVNTLKKVTTK